MSDTKHQCKGKNCNAVSGTDHSVECEAKHNKIVFLGAGNRNPEARYEGYQNRSFHCKNPDEAEAWKEGQRAREPRAN